MEQQQEHYYIEMTGSTKCYVVYDKVHRTARLLPYGDAVQISGERLAEFINTAKVLGFNAGKL